jgi:hypothetical protein
MGRFSEDNSIEYSAFERQRHCCALCGKELVPENFEKGTKGAWAAHHINGDPEDHNLSNCACLCINEPENCHLFAHHGNFSGNRVIPRSQFRYLYG